MKGKTIHHSMETWLAVIKAGLHHLFRPLVIIHVRSAADLCDRVISSIVSHICLVSAVLIRIMLRAHISAASPVLIADTEVIDLPRLLMTVLLAQVCHRGYAVERNVLYPLAHLTNRTASEVAVDIGLATKLTAQFKELVCSEAVVLDNAAPVCIDHFLSGCFRSDTVHPVIFVCKASARPAQHRNLHFF